MTTNDSAIALLDSGAGGLTVFKEIVCLMPNEQLYYFGDTQNMPLWLQT